MTFECIRKRIEGKVGIITFDRPRVLNAFNQMLIHETSDALQSLVADPHVSAIVLHGAGRAFSAGFDLKESAQRKIEGTDAWRRLLMEDFEFIIQFWDCPKPTIAAVHGYCLAGAFELALACDITVAAEGTRFGEPEVRFGSGIVAMLLPWMTTPKIAKELLLTGVDSVDASRALDMGIVNHVVQSGQEFEKAMAIAGDLVAAAPLSVQLTKQAINRSYEVMGMRQALLASLDTDLIIESAMGPERVEFNRIREEHGLKAAIAWRDTRFGAATKP